MPRNQNNRSEDSYIVNDILPAFADYGYPVAGDSENLKIKGDIRIRMGSTYKEPDVVFYADNVPVLLVEAKKENKSQSDAEDQAKSYIRNFPIEKYSRDGRPPQYAAITIGKTIYFYKYEFDINQYGAIIDRLEPISEILTYDELRKLYGLKEREKPILGPEGLKNVFYQLISALDFENKKKISPEIVLRAVKLLYEFLKDSNNYTSRSPYTELDGHPDRQRWIRNVLRQYNWQNLNEKIADQFRTEILRAFQGSKQLNQYLTPWPVVVFMTRLVNLQPQDKVLDFECGSGGFLVAAVRSGIPLDNVLGVDIADLPYYVSKVFLALNFNIKGADIDSIPVYNDNGLKDWGSDWDVVISNPAGGEKYQLNDLDEIYHFLEKDIDLDGKIDPAWEYNFSIQRAIRSAKIGGRICLILPEGFFSNSSAEFLRKYVAKHCRIKAIISLPRKIFYKGTTVRQVQGGRQVSQQKMSILLAVKTKEVNDGEGIDLDNININYPVFLSAIQKPNIDDPDWLDKILGRVLEEYEYWQNNKTLTDQNNKLKFSSLVKKNKRKQKKSPVENRKIHKIIKKSKPKTKEEIIIPDDLDKLF